MKNTEVNQPGESSHAIIRGHKGGHAAGSAGIPVRDAVGNAVVPARSIRFMDAVVAGRNGGEAQVTVGGTAAAAVNAPITAALSNPPTQAELEAAIGFSAAEVSGQSYPLIDSDTGRRYGVVSDGSALVFVPLVGTAGDLVTLASAAGIFNDFQTQTGAAQYDPVSNKTFWCYLNAAGSVMVRSWDHATSTASAATTLNTALSPGDSHAQPSLGIRPSDRYIGVFYSDHNGANMYVRISSSPADISAFGAETNIDGSIGGTQYTYGIAHALSDATYLFVRTHPGGALHADAMWTYTKSTDDWATWSAGVEVLNDPSHGIYWIPSKTTTDRIDFLSVSRAPFDEAGGSVYHMYMVNETFYTTDGTEITATKPFLAAEGTLVFAGGASQRPDPGQVIIGSDGYPRALFREFEDNSPEDCRYMWSGWNGLAWSTPVEIAAAGSGSLTATCVFADGDPYTVYYSQDDGSGVAQIHKATSTDDGATWTDTQITDSANEQGLLAMVRDGAPELKVLWVQKSGGWTRDDTVAADFLGGSSEPVENADAQPIVFIDDTGRGEAIIQRTADGAWQISRDMGSTWEDIGGADAFVVIQGPTPTVTVGPPFSIAITSKWGLSGGVPYYDSAAVVSGEEAALVWDPLAERYAVVSCVPA